MSRKKSLQERLASGNAGKRPLPPEPAAPPAPAAAPIVRPPPDLSPEALEVWDSLAEEMRLVGALGPTSAPLFAALCEWVVIRRKAVADVHANGAVTLAPTGHKRLNPSLEALRTADSMLSKLSAQLGLDPRSRGKITPLGVVQLDLPGIPPRPDADAHARFFGPAGGFRPDDDDPPPPVQ